MSDDDEPLAGNWTRAKLRGKTAAERYTIWEHAKRKATPDTLHLAATIEALGLPYGPDGGISMDDPRVLEMRDIIESPEGREACLEKTRAGQPALAGVEPMLVKAMGARYGGFSQITVTAGSIVGELMRSEGYDVVGQRKMPPGSVAKTAAIFAPRK